MTDYDDNQAGWWAREMEALDRECEEMKTLGYTEDEIREIRSFRLDELNTEARQANAEAFGPETVWDVQGRL